MKEVETPFKLIQYAADISFLVAREAVERGVKQLENSV